MLLKSSDSHLNGEKTYRSKLQLLVQAFLFMWILFIPMKTVFYQLGVVGLISIFVYYVFVERHIARFKSLLTEYADLIMAFSLIVVCMVIANMFSPYVTSDSWRTLFHFIVRHGLVLLVLLFFLQEGLLSRKLVLTALGLSLAVQGIDGLIQGFAHVDFIKGNQGSFEAGLTGATFSRNVFGMFMAIGLGLTVSILTCKTLPMLPRKKLLLFAIFSFIFLTGVLFSYSRSSWLFVGVFLLVWFILNAKNVTRVHVTFVASILGLILLAFMFSESLDERLQMLINGYSSYRYEIWEHALQLIQERWLLGYGVDTYSVVGMKNFGGVHNSTLEIFLYTGVVGFAAYAFLLYKTIVEIYRSKRYHYFMFLVAFLIMIQFDYSVMSGIATLSMWVIFLFFVFSNRVDAEDDSRLIVNDETNKD
jgi:O-antigen ligase